MSLNLPYSVSSICMYFMLWQTFLEPVSQCRNSTSIESSLSPRGVSAHSYINLDAKVIEFQFPKAPTPTSLLRFTIQPAQTFELASLRNCTDNEMFNSTSTIQPSQASSRLKENQVQSAAPANEPPAPPPAPQGNGSHSSQSTSIPLVWPSSQPNAQIEQVWSSGLLKLNK
jgi:hypothetical protein